MKSIIKNFSYTLTSNLFAFFISAFISFILPRFIGIESYSFFQLYVFYIGYTGLFHLGIADGIFLRYGGEYYNDIDKSVISGQARVCIALDFIIFMILSTAVYFFVSEQGKKLVMLFASIMILITPIRIVFYNLLLTTNRIKEAAKTTILQKVIYLILIVVGILLQIKTHIYYMLSNIISELLSACFTLWVCRDIIKTAPCEWKITKKESKTNISVGIKLTFATLVSALIIGIIRISIENQWDVVTFGKVSITMSVSNLLMVLIRAVALVIFPVLHRIGSNKLSNVYNTMRTCLMIPLFGMLVFYYPMKIILSSWLPQYADSLVYMALLFPMCVFESKMSMLIETYMKTLRKERWLLWVNVITVGLSMITTLITTYWLHNLDLAVASIVFLLAFRCVFAELLLSTSLDIDVKKDIILELLLTVIFIFASWFIGGIAGLIVYIFAYIIYLVFKYKDMILVLANAKKILQK